MQSFILAEMQILNCRLASRRLVLFWFESLAFIFHKGSVQLATGAFVDAGLALPLANLRIIALAALAAALFHASDQYAVMVMVNDVAGVEMLFECIMSVAVTPVQPVAVVKVAAATPSKIVVAATRGLTQEVFYAHNSLGLCARMRFLVDIPMFF